MYRQYSNNSQIYGDFARSLAKLSRARFDSLTGSNVLRDLNKQKYVR
jgi:hypothetical protein